MTKLNQEIPVTPRQGGKDMEIKYTVNGQEYTEEVTEENLRAANECYDKLTWEAEIEKAHPIVNHFQKHQWPWITRFNGWLPLPPAWLD